MSLHYLVKLKMLIAHMLPLSCYRSKLQNLSCFNYCLQFTRFESIIDTREQVYKTRITDLELSTMQLTTNGCRNDDMLQLGTVRFYRAAWNADAV